MGECGEGDIPKTVYLFWMVDHFSIGYHGYKDIHLV